MSSRGGQVVASLPWRLCYCLFVGRLCLQSALAEDAEPVAPSPAPGPGPAPLAAAVNTYFVNHGTDWKQGSCASRRFQSPVSLDHGLKEPQADIFKYHYHTVVDPSNQLVAKNGTLSVDFTGKFAGKVVYKKALFELQRLDIKGPAEHLILGKRYPLELQLVHKKVSSGGLDFSLIISVFVWCEIYPAMPRVGTVPAMIAGNNIGEIDFNQLLLPLTQQPGPTAEGVAVPVAASPQVPFDIGLLLEDRTVPPAQREETPFLAYSGSLTAPPCEETAWWLVRRDPIMASNSQVAALANAIFALTGNQGNFRHVMPLNKRKTIVVGPQYEATLAAPWVDPASVGATGHQPLPWGQEPRTDAELHTHNKAARAAIEAEHSAAYAKDLANRLAKGEQAYARQLEDPPREVPLVPGDGKAEEVSPIPDSPGLAPAFVKAVETGSPYAEVFVRAEAGDAAWMPLVAAGQRLRGQTNEASNIAHRMIVAR